MQKKTADFSRLQTILNSIMEQIKTLKDENSSWCKEVKEVISSLKDNYDITIGSTVGITRNASTFSNIEDFRKSVAIPYIDVLISNIENHFSEQGV